MEREREREREIEKEKERERKRERGVGQGQSIGAKPFWGLNCMVHVSYSSGPKRL